MSSKDSDTPLRGELDARLEKLEIEINNIQQNINHFNEDIEFACYILETLKKNGLR